MVDEHGVLRQRNRGQTGGTVFLYPTQRGAVVLVLQALAPVPGIPAELWLEMLRRHPFLAAMAINIAAQACLPLLHWREPRDALGWCDDFVTIVVHPGEAVARRESRDEAGVVHHYTEVLAGEAMERGPDMLSWQHVQDAGRSAGQGTNVVVHEFVHKLDMKSGHANGWPLLPAGFLGTQGARAAHEAWWAAWEPTYQQFREAVIKAELFGTAWPWLDA